MVRKTLLLISLGLMLTAVGCSGMSAIAGGVGDIAGMDTSTEEVTLTVGQVCTECAPATHSTLNPTEEPIKFEKVGIADVDTFVESANKLYMSVLVTEKMVGISQNLATDPNLKVEGFNNPEEVLNLAKGLFTTASTDAPNLMSSGTSVLTNIASIAADKPLMVPAATEQINLAIERLTAATEKLTELGGSFAE